MGELPRLLGTMREMLKHQIVVYERQQALDLFPILIQQMAHRRWKRLHGLPDDC